MISAKYNVRQCKTYDQGHKFAVSVPAWINLFGVPSRVANSADVLLSGGRLCKFFTLRRFRAGRICALYA